MTQKEWNDLPLLLTRSQFLAVTGLNSSDLSALVRAGNIVPQVMAPSASRQGLKRRARYRKVDAARMVGLGL